MGKADLSNQKPLFCNECELSKELFMKYAKISYYRYRKRLRIMAAILFLILLAIGLLCMLLWKLWVIGILVTLLSLYFFFMFFWGYLYSGNASYHNLEDFYGTPIRMNVVFYPKYFKVETEKGTNEFLYSQIQDIVTKKDLSIIIVGSNGIIQHGQVIDFKAFTPEDKEQYLSLVTDIRTCNS